LAWELKNKFRCYIISY